MGPHAQAHIRNLDGRGFCIAFVALVLALCIHLSRGRLFWSDEIFGWMLVTDPSLRHMLVAWRAGADGGGILFYLLARAWLGLWGASELSFRLFSATGVGAAAALTFLLLRRFVRWTIAAPIVALLWFSSDVVLWQMLQARFYGLLLVAVAAATLLYAIGSARERVGWGVLASTFVCHTLLVGTHPFGAVYSMALLGAMLVVSTSRRQVPSMALAALSGWWIVLPSLPALRSSAAVARPHFWTMTPTAAELVATYTCWSLPVAIVLGVGAVAMLGLRALRPPHERLVTPERRDLRSIAIGAGLLLAVPAVVWVASLGSTSVFVDRYLVPVVIPVALLLAGMAQTLLARTRARWVRSVLGVVAAGLLLWTGEIAWVLYPKYAAYPGHDVTAALVQALPRGVPIVVEPVDLFDRLVLYRRAPGLAYVSVLDWAEATSPNAPRGEVSGFHQMENWHTVGYFTESILDTATLLGRGKPFAVVDVDGLHWFEDRVRGNPGFVVELLTTLRLPDGSNVRIWMVRPVNTRD